MFIQVATTLLRSATLLSTLFVAFAVTFHKLLTLPEEACFQEFEEATREHKNRLAYCFLGFEHLNQSADVLGSRAKMGLPIKVYGSIGWALFQTLMMMVGEYDHTELIVEPYLDGMSATIYTPELTFPFFAAFVFLVPITLMNLLVSLIGLKSCFQEFEEATREHKNRLAYCFLGFEHLNQSADVLGSRAKMGLPIKVYGSIGWALFQTLMMMVGEYDHTELIVEPYLDGMSATIYTPELTFPFFAAFVFLVPITLMNLLVSLIGFEKAC
ncbi:hypothetical protein AHF37_03981 [Paragonimus kellicotti]|nr:hypothetical protein AHF37_03981 [Paragonimus kellicotti]